MLDPWYVTGFCDGEAAFTYSRNGSGFALYFGVKQREDNRQIIEEIHKFFNYAGYIYRGKETEGSPMSGLSKPSAYYRVTRLNELKIITGHFDKYPLQSAKKLEAYKIWRDMVMHKIENYRSSDYNLLHFLAGELSALNSQSRAFKIHKK